MRILTASTAAIAAAATLLAVPASAQSVDEIVAKHIAARGGYDKIKAIQSMKITRTVATPFSSVKVVVFKKRPALVRFEQTAAGQTTANVRGINADAAWDTGPGGKITTRTAQLASEARETDADFDGLLVDWKEKGHTVTLEGKEQMTGWEGYKLKVTTKSGVVREIYIDTDDLSRSAACRHRDAPLTRQCPRGREATPVQLHAPISATGKRSTV